MKNRFFLFAILTTLIFLAGCGKGETAPTDTFWDIAVETSEFPYFEEVFNADGERHWFKCLGTQFLGEEPVQLWADLIGGVKIYLYRLSGERELLLEGGVATSLLDELYEWYLDQEGGFFCIKSSEQKIIRKLDAQGKEVYRVFPPGYVESLRQAPDGRVYLALWGVSGREGITLAEINPEDGSITILEKPQVERSYNSYEALGFSGEGPAVVGKLGIRAVDTETGELTDILRFQNTSYDTSGSGMQATLQSIMDFRVKEDGSVEVVRAALDGSASFERLELKEVQRIRVTICGKGVSWLKVPIARFNQENDTYYIMVDEAWEDYGMSDADYEKSLDDYARRIGVELATGKGPDLLIGEEILGDGILEIIEKGAIENLAPYMERSGIREEDYFSTAFDYLRMGEEIYGVGLTSVIVAYEADARILGPEPDIWELTETLLALEEKAVFIEGVSAGELLHYFLEGSETFWGMVDWEAGTCDFGGELFADLLEAARRYGDDPHYAYRSIAYRRYYADLYHATTPSERKEMGVSLIGGMFDDGCHAIARETGTHIMINSNSLCKEGAWEFLRFLLGDEFQQSSEYIVLGVPIKKDAVYGGWLDSKLKNIGESTGVLLFDYSILTGEWELLREYYAEDRKFIENEKLSNFIQLLEEAKYLPLRTRPLLEIVCEEAEGYFNGGKSVEEVVAIIERRVGLYLSEHADVIIQPASH